MNHKLFFGYEYGKDKKRGKIYLNSIHFANFYTLEDWGANSGLVFNRDSQALDMQFPAAQKPFNNIQEMEEFIINNLK